jgi:hypothetical protein
VDVREHLTAVDRLAAASRSSTTTPTAWSIVDRPSRAARRELERRDADRGAPRGG